MRLYLLVLRRDRDMVGRQEIAADDATGARLIAGAVFDGCGEDCDSFELWDGAYRIDARLPLTAGGLSRLHQAQVIAAEEAIARSRWAIARSKRLLARLGALKAAQA